MGLDQYAFAIDNNGEKEELAYWRKHPNLQGFMENLWYDKGCPGRPEESNEMGLSDFNCIPVELDHDDLDSLEAAVTNTELPSTTGFFFGENSDADYRHEDLEFIAKARKALDSGKTVVYDSWW